VSPFPSVDELLDSSVGFALPMRTRFRGVRVRRGLLLRGPVGWAEFAPFAEYGAEEAARWLAAAVESAWVGWPDQRRTIVAVNAIVPPVAPGDAADLVKASGCTIAKVKVAEPDQSLADDVARVAAVRDVLGNAGRIRVDANGAWTTEQALRALNQMRAHNLEYVEQPCASLVECAALRALTDVPIAVDEAVRKALDPHHVVGLREAADVLILKAAPLGGVRPALAVAETYGLPCVVSSALDSSVGLAAGLALAAALPELPFACGLGSGQLFIADVTGDRVLPVDGTLAVRAAPPEPDTVMAVAMAPADLAAWHQRLRDAYAALTDSPGGD
jgi:O-succinylbenzoate synthase